MAALTSPQSRDRQSYVDFTTIIQRERTLLDELHNLKGEIKWLSETISLLSLTSSSPSTDPQILAIAKILSERKKRESDIVGHIR